MTANALTIVHKYIRNELFDMSRLLASAGPADCETLSRRMNELVELLHAHAEHEEHGFEPKLREVDPAEADRLLRDHGMLDADLDRIHESVQALGDLEAAECSAALLRLHLDWNRFLGRYLLHLDDEECSLFAVIHGEIPPIEAMVRGARERDPAGAAEFLERVVALIAPDEREAIERGKAM